MTFTDGAKNHKTPQRYWPTTALLCISISHQRLIITSMGNKCFIQLHDY